MNHCLSASDRYGVPRIASQSVRSDEIGDCGSGVAVAGAGVGVGSDVAVGGTAVGEAAIVGGGALVAAAACGFPSFSSSPARTAVIATANKVKPTANAERT